MAMIYNSIPYFPTQVSFFEEVAMELIEARYGMKAETAVMKLVCKIYKETDTTWYGMKNSVHSSPTKWEGKLRKKRCRELWRH